MQYQQFDKNKKWFKANFHSHSTQSDGLLTPAQLVELYKKEGYSLLMLSEHELYQDTKEFDTDDFLLYPGIERSIQLPNYETFHIQGIANSLVQTDRYHHLEHIPIPKFHSLQDVQQMIDELKDHGNFVMINHPYWSFNTCEHLLALENYDFLELYNHNCHVETDLGNNEIFYDELLRYKPIGALACDDNHNSHRYEEGIHMWDSFGGFTMIQASALTRDSISEAIQSGTYYASTGPEIYQFEIHDQQVHVTCSEVKEIIFKAWPRRGYSIQSKDNLLTEGTYTLRGQEQWIRVKCIDENGNSAWSNPIYIKE